MTLTLEWVGRREEEPWVRRGDPPPADAFLQLFYRLNLLYAEAFDLDPRWGHGVPSSHSWYRTYPEWRGMLRDYPVVTFSRPAPPLRDWPTHALVPPMAPEARLRFESLAMASPLDLIFHLPAAVVVPGGAAGIIGFVRLLEKVWNAPKRIRLEGMELDRKIFEEEKAFEHIRHKHQDLKGDGFALREGSVQFPDDWNWPKEK